jgi:hypothetical protein
VRRASAIVGALALLCGCKSPQAQITVSFPSAGDGGCAAQTRVGCVNYLRFTVHDQTGFNTHCVTVPQGQALTSLCDVADLAQGQELFKLSPDTLLSVKLEGMRVFPATSCEPQESCDPRYIFSGTSQSVRLGDIAGGTLEIPLEMVLPCQSEDFFFLAPGTRGGTCLTGNACTGDLSCVSGVCVGDDTAPDGGTLPTPCESLCGSASLVVCDGIQGGCLCASPASQ